MSRHDVSQGESICLKSNTRSTSSQSSSSSSTTHELIKSASFKDLSTLLEILHSTPSIQSHEIVCRICLTHDKEDKQQLCQPCNCKGSSRYIHRECLEKWRSVSINPSSKLQCDVCLSYYKFKSSSIKGVLTLGSAKFMTLVGMLTLQTTTVWSLAYLTLLLVNSLNLPPPITSTIHNNQQHHLQLAQPSTLLYPLQHLLLSINAFQYWPGLFILGAFNQYKKNNLYTALIFTSVLSIMGRINVILGIFSHVLWLLFVCIGLWNVGKSTKFKIDLAAPKLFNLLVEISSEEGEDERGIMDVEN